MKVLNNKGLIKAWTDLVDVEEGALLQADRVASLPFIFKYVVLMPDVHQGIGSTVGSVVPTRGAIIPAAVSLDIGCGMISRHYDLNVNELTEHLPQIRQLIESNIPHGRSNNGQSDDIGAWSNNVPDIVRNAYEEGIAQDYEQLLEETENAIKHEKVLWHLGTLGTGNHFIEFQMDKNRELWITIHSGSRGPGAKIGNVFMKKAKELMAKYFITLPDPGLAYLPEGEDLFNQYWLGLQWAQKYAWTNRLLMLSQVEQVLAPWISSSMEIQTVHCHHNYVRKEHHFGQNIFVTRKGAISAKQDEWGIIPGSMGTSTYIVQGLGNREAFCSASHGAGRRMSRAQAKRVFTIEDHLRAIDGIECFKDVSLIDETPGSYKDIEAVMASQMDLVQIKERLIPILVVKGTNESIEDW
jgi:tRNA-splicing ligase RtcB (3'-phosphate/5'-hydroxy nucleic acid ligase)